MFFEHYEYHNLSSFKEMRKQDIRKYLIFL